MVNSVKSFFQINKNATTYISFIKVFPNIFSKTDESSIVSAWVLIPQANHHSGFFSVPRHLTSPFKLKKSPDNSNMLHMLNNNTSTDFRKTLKHILIPSFVIQVS